MDRAKKKFASAIDGLRSFGNKADIAVDEKVTPEHCSLHTVVRHGFPDDARCLAYDPVQRLLAIGTGHGHVRIIGDAGVDYLLRHESEQAVLHMQFLINEGGLITACANDMIHLWNYRQKVPEVVHSVQLNKEAVTAIHLPIASKWLYVGTDKGNVYFVSVATFQLSPYVINWNKAIDLSCRVHPGAIRQLIVSPVDPLKLLIAYDKGVLVQWNLATKEVDRFPLDPPIKSVSCHYDGRQILTGNVDGSISMYSMKKTNECVQRSTPHGTGPCRPIPLIEWKHINENEQVIVFSGGMPTDDGLPVPAITVLRGGRSATVLEMDHPIISLITLPLVAYTSCPQQPHAVAVLLKNDLMLLDLQQQGYPVIESPHAMNIHESPVTCVAYYSDCPLDLIGALTLVGTKQRKKDYSARTWPITGGIGRECATGHQELVITGHKDGTVRFWQESGEHLQILYRLKTASHFERLEEMEVSDKVSHAVKSVELCLESRQLLVAGNSGQVTLFRFVKTESMNTIAVVNIPLLGSASTSWAPGPGSLDDKASTPGAAKEIRRQRKVMSRESTNSLDTSDSGDERIVPFKVRGAPVKRPPGFQPELACFVPWPSHAKVDTITAVALNSAYGVIALGTSCGLALVDIAQCALIYAWTTSELYGSEPTPAIQLSSQFSEAPSPVESPSSLEPPRSALVRGNTESRQRPPFESRRPQLFKAQSVIESSNGSPRSSGGGGGGGGETPRDSSGSRAGNASPSNSSQSLERASSSAESVTSLHFIHSHFKRNDPKQTSCLWVGTSAGTTIALNLILPEDRFVSTVVVAPSGTVVKLKGQVIYQTFMDGSFCLTSPASESYKESSRESRDTSSPEKSLSNRVLTKGSLAPQYSNSVDVNDEISQVLVVVAEMEVKVVALPSFSQLFVHKCEEIPLVKAYATHVRGFPVLMCLNAAGQVVVLSLPSLRLLHTSALLPHSVEIEDSICQKMSFSDHGLGVYMASPTEIEKYTICSELADQTADSLGELFVPCEMPEAPKNHSFLKGVSSIFSGTPRQDSCSIETILSDSKEKNALGTSGMRSVARTIPGPSMSMDRAHAGGVSAGQAAAMALQNLNERTEKLNATVDATENLKNNAMNLSSRTGKLVEKYEKKKWYNF